MHFWANADFWSHQVKNKAWFGAHRAFRALLYDWTIQTVAVDSMLDFVWEDRIVSYKHSSKEYNWVLISPNKDGGPFRSGTKKRWQRGASGCM